MSGLPFYTSATGAIYIPLPAEAWRMIEGGCACSTCRGPSGEVGRGYWDTLVVPGRNDRQPFTFTVHFPELHIAGQPPDWLQRGHRRTS